MLLAGDVGGTKTRLGLFRRAPRRPSPVAIHTFMTNAFGSFTEILQAFVQAVEPSTTIEAAALGVAGPVVNEQSHLTNILWNISAAEVRAFCAIDRAFLLNDLEAMAHCIDVLEPDELLELQPGVPQPEGNAAVIAAGTGLGEAYLHRVNGRYNPAPTEAGHADFAPRSDREIDLLRTLRSRYGRVDVERVLSGPGLLNLHTFTHGSADCPAVADAPPGQEPAAISAAAMANHCPRCREALGLFVSAYGSEAGNLALRGMATGGVYVGGGIAPRILPLLRDGDFMRAFRDKAPMTDLLSRIPVRVILNPEAGLLGAAVYANRLAAQESA